MWKDLEVELMSVPPISDCGDELSIPLIIF